MATSLVDQVHDQMAYDSKDIFKTVLYLHDVHCQSWWNGLKYKILNISKTEHDFSMKQNKKLNCALKTTCSETFIF